MSFQDTFDELEEVMLISKNPIGDVIFRSEFDEDSENLRDILFFEYCRINARASKSRWEENDPINDS